MTPIQINVNTSNAAEATKLKLALQKLANNVNLSNLNFLADLSQKSGINDTLENPINRIAIKTKL